MLVYINTDYIICQPFFIIFLFFCQNSAFYSIFTSEKRSYDTTMMGVLGLYTPDSDKVGSTRALSFNPNIKSVRGYLEKGTEDNISDIDYTNILTPSEILNPFVSTKDDPPQTGRYNRNII